MRGAPTMAGDNGLTFRCDAIMVHKAEAYMRGKLLFVRFIVNPLQCPGQEPIYVSP